MDALIKTKDFYNAYKKMHWDRVQSFSGFGVLDEADYIADLVERTGSITALDYGAGKGWQYMKGGFRLDLVKDDAQINPRILKAQHVNRLFNISDDNIDWYEPSLKWPNPHRKLKDKKYDGVICIDVMEHVPLQEVDNVLFNIFSRADKFVYITISCMPAKKKFPGGQNVHVTVKPPEWWRKRCSDMLRWVNFRGTCSLKCQEETKDGSVGVTRMKFGIPR